MQNLEETSPLCKICFQSPRNTLLSCSHSFCNTCLATFLSLKILEGEVFELKCPDCSIPLTTEEIRSLISEETFKKYENFLSVKELLKNKFVRLCPEPDCKGFDISTSSNLKLNCRLCSFQYCYNCSEPWHKGKCKKSEDSKFQSWGKRQNMKICPRCRCYVLRTGGCNHMTCPKCSTFWCWTCGQEFEGHTQFNCLVGKKLFDLYWRTILICFLFPVSFFYLFFFMIWYFIEINDVPFKCCSKHKVLNLILAFLVSPVMGLICFPVVMCILLVRSIFKNTCLDDIKYCFGKYCFGKCCSMSLASGCFWIWYPFCFIAFIGFGVALSVFLPALAVVLSIFKVVKLFKS